MRPPRWTAAEDELLSVLWPLEEPEDILNAIQQRKDLISQGIIHVLSTQRLQEKQCPGFGRRLAWNWPHRLCDDCFLKQRRRLPGAPSRSRY